MRDTLISLVSLFLAMLLLMLGSGLLGTLLGFRMALDGHPSVVTGLVMAGYYAGLVAGARLCPRVVRRVGHIRAFAVFGALNCAVVMLHGMFVAPLAWGVLRVFTGIAMMGLYMVVESWLNERAPREIRGRLFSVYMVTTFAGLGLGQFMLVIGVPGSTEQFLIVGILFALCLIPIALTRAVHPRPVEALHFNIRQLLRLAPFGVIGCVGAGLINGAFYSLGPVFGHAAGMGAAGVAAFMGATILGGLVLQWPVGMLSDRHDRRLVMAGLGIALAAASLLVITVTQQLAMLLLIAALFGGLAFTIYPVAVAHAHDHIDPQDIVPASGALILTFGVGACLGPILGAVCMALAGAQGLFIYIAACGVLLGAIVLWQHGREPVSVAEQTPYVPMPRTSPVIAQLDPRLETDEGST